MGGLHQVGEDAGDEDQDEGDGREEECCAGEVWMGYAQSDEQESNEARSGVPEVARAGPDKISCDGYRQQQGQSGTGAKEEVVCDLAVKPRHVAPQNEARCIPSEKTWEWKK